MRPRSGLAARHGVTVLNTPGTIDADYRGEIQVILINLGSEPFIVTRGMRIAQLVIAPVARAGITEVADARRHRAGRRRLRLDGGVTPLIRSFRGAHFARTRNPGCRSS